MLRTVGDQPSLWESLLPAELLVLPVELARVDALLDDPVFFTPFVGFFDDRLGRPSIPLETYLRMWAGGWIPDRLIFMFQAALLVSYQSRSASFGVRYWSAECSRF